jgi:hypothetical protein
VAQLCDRWHPLSGRTTSVFPSGWPHFEIVRDPPEIEAAGRGIIQIIHPTKEIEMSELFAFRAHRMPTIIGIGNNIFEAQQLCGLMNRSRAHRNMVSVEPVADAGGKEPIDIATEIKAHLGRGSSLRDGPGQARAYDSDDESAPTKGLIRRV